MIRLYLLGNWRFTAKCLLKAPPDVAPNNSTLCTHSTSTYIVWFSQVTVVFSMHSIKPLACMIEMKCCMWGRYWTYISRSQCPRGLRPRSAAARLLKSWVRFPPWTWKFVCWEYCVLSGRGLCDGLITRPYESYRLWCVVCDLQTSWMRPWPTGGCRAKNKQTNWTYIILKNLWRQRQIIFKKVADAKLVHHLNNGFDPRCAQNYKNAEPMNI
jgi:hypothetical protein